MLDLKSELAAAAGLQRRLRSSEVVGPAKIAIDGCTVINFADNDYLGLSRHPKVKAAAAAGVARFGTGSGASRLISGDNILYESLERKLASLKGTEAALVFASGYHANIGILTVLAGRDDIVFSDRLSHASLIDGCRISGALLKRYPHNDVDTLRKWLEGAGGYRRRLIVTDAVFSMDGDLAPLPELSVLAEEYKAVLVTDDAHGTGILGAGGAGTADYLGVKNIPVQIGTLSKALGSMGGFVAGSRDLIDQLINKARTLIFTTALPPASLAASIAALDIVAEDFQLREELAANNKFMRRALRTHGMETGDSPTPIIPIIVGAPERAVNVSAGLLSQGFFVPAIRPPAVPPNSSRLRLTVSALHTEEQMKGLALALEKEVSSEGVRSKE